MKKSPKPIDFIEKYAILFTVRKNKFTKRGDQHEKEICDDSV